MAFDFQQFPVIDLLLGDCRGVLETLAVASIDACVTDPPYHLTARKKGGSGEASLNLAHPAGRSRITTGGGFMGQQWDGGDVTFQVETWQEVLRVLKPGAHLLAFGGTRTYHRMVCAIEDAGFEVRDQIGWVYGSGFPKSHNLDGDWDGWGTALKPAWEPIVLARKPLNGTVALNVEAHGVGAINIDGCRVPGTPEPTRFNPAKHGHKGWRMNATGAECAANASSLGRWPANLIHDGSDDVLALFPVVPGQLAKASSNPDSPRTKKVYSKFERADDPMVPRGDTGSAARFFYCAKANKADRGPANGHPTVKPTDLMRYLCRLVTPPGGTVLDPFMGSGSTGRGALLEGFSFTGIEASDSYLTIARRRVTDAYLTLL